jgi:hypothetical protein
MALLFKLPTLNEIWRKIQAKKLDALHSQYEEISNNEPTNYFKLTTALLDLIKGLCDEFDNECQIYIKSNLSVTMEEVITVYKDILEQLNHIVNKLTTAIPEKDDHLLTKINLYTNLLKDKINIAECNLEEKLFHDNHIILRNPILSFIFQYPEKNPLVFKGGTATCGIFLSAFNFFKHYSGTLKGTETIIPKGMIEASITWLVSPTQILLMAGIYCSYVGIKHLSKTTINELAKINSIKDKISFFSSRNLEIENSIKLEEKDIYLECKQTAYNMLELTKK